MSTPATNTPHDPKVIAFAMNGLARLCVTERDERRMGVEKGPMILIPRAEVEALAQVAARALGAEAMAVKLIGEPLIIDANEN